MEHAIREQKKLWQQEDTKQRKKSLSPSEILAKQHAEVEKKRKQELNRQAEVDRRKLTEKREKEELAEKVKKQERQKRYQQLEKEIEQAKNTPLLTLSESVDVAKEIISGGNRKSLNEQVEFLEGSGETKNLIVSFNEGLVSQYQDKIRNLYLSHKNKHKQQEIMEGHIEADVKKCMELGLNNLMKTFGENAIPSRSESTASSPKAANKSKIKKTHSWDELKDKF